MKRDLGFLALLGFLAFGAAIPRGYLMDDHPVLQATPALRHWSLANVIGDFRTDLFSGRGDPYYRPLQRLTHRVDLTVWGMDPRPAHLENLLLHIANACLLFLLGLRFGMRRNTAWLAAAFFAVHPIIVSELLMITGRGEILSLTFMLAALYALDHESEGAGWLGVGAYGCALLTKESALMLPALWIVLWPLRRPSHAVRRLAVLLVLSLAYIGLRSAVMPPLRQSLHAEYIPLFFLKAFPHVVWHDIFLLLFPFSLHSLHMMPPMTHLWPLAALTVYGGILACALTRRMGALALLLWFVLALLPKTIPMMNESYLFDHWAYPSSIALWIALASGFERLQENRRGRWRSWGRWAPIGCLAVWMGTSQFEVAVRRNDEQNFRWTLRWESQTSALFNLGSILLQTGRPREALPYLETAARRYPDNPDYVRIRDAARRQAAL